MTQHSVPLHDGRGKAACSLVVRTHPDGHKTTWFDSLEHIKGAFARLGGTPSDKIIIAIDYESGVALHHATGHPVAVCLFYENLPSVSASLRARYPEKDLFIAAGGALEATERAKDLICSAAISANCSVSHAPGGLTFGDAFALMGTPAGLKLFSTVTRPEDLPATRRDCPSTEVVPFTSPVDGIELLRLVREHYARHTALSPLQILAISLWTLASWVPERFSFAPILALLSLTRRCGKTSAIAALKPLLRRPIAVSDVTAAALQDIADGGELPILDELDQYLDRHRGLVPVLNAGHSREASVIRRKGAAYNVFGFKVLSAIGELPATTVDRAIVIPFVRKSVDMRVVRYAPTPGDHACALHAMIRRFWLDNAADLSERDLPEPDVENDRARDNWRPLLAVSRLLGPDTLEETLSAAKELTRGGDDNPHIVEEFIFDVVRVFVDDGRAFISSEKLIRDLCGDPERPWATFSRGKPLSFRDLAKLMRDAKVPVGEQFNDGTRNVRGYWRRDLQPLIDGYGGKSR